MFVYIYTFSTTVYVLFRNRMAIANAEPIQVYEGKYKQPQLRIYGCVMQYPFLHERHLTSNSRDRIRTEARHVVTAIHVHTVLVLDWPDLV